ncbi:MAG: transcription termination/antitermination protein NusG [bacterium]
MAETIIKAAGDNLRMEKSWYVVHTYSGYENKVKNNLERRLKTMGLADKIEDILIPTEEVEEKKGGKKRITTKKFFPGYILVKMVMTDDAWYIVRHTPGVFGFIGQQNKPVPLKEEDVKNILHQIDLGETRVGAKVAFEEGESIKVVEGPFTNFVGEVKEINLKQNKVKVMMNILGRLTPVELEFGQVEKL